jgi:hypothetical protein
MFMKEKKIKCRKIQKAINNLRGGERPLNGLRPSKYDARGSHEIYRILIKVKFFSLFELRVSILLIRIFLYNMVTTLKAER